MFDKIKKKYREEKSCMYTFHGRQKSWWPSKNFTIVESKTWEREEAHREKDEGIGKDAKE